MSTDRELLELAAKALERADKISGHSNNRKTITALRAALAEPAPQQEVAWLPSSEWVACTKLPVTVHVRQQRPGETHVSTREGITPIKPDDLIIRGVAGEEYPIGKKIFEKTYRIGNTSPQPVQEHLSDEQIEDLLGIGNPTAEEKHLIRLGFNAAHASLERKE